MFLAVIVMFLFVNNISAAPSSSVIVIVRRACLAESCLWNNVGVATLASDMGGFDTRRVNVPSTSALKNVVS